jgi:hypothetical protein
MTYGNFYYGKKGFLFKKQTAGGAKWVQPLATICNQPQNIYNKYVPGSGVGASSTATRRAKLLYATSCNKTQQCNTRVYSRVGLYGEFNRNLVAQYIFNV